MANEMTRAELQERVLTDLSRRRALTEAESLSLEQAIDEQRQPRLDRLGRRRPRRYSGGLAELEDPRNV